MPGTIITTDFMRYLVQKGIALLDDVGIRASIPPGIKIPIEYAPTETGTVWLLYYLSFGEIRSNVFAIKCKFMKSKYGGMVFEHECRPCDYAVIDTGCPFWCPITKGFPFEVTIENLTNEPQLFVGRLWQLRISEVDMPLLQKLYDRFMGEINVKVDIDLSEVIDQLKAIKEELTSIKEQLTVRRIDPWLRYKI